MQPVTGGRHCSQCEKVVVDFTRMTDAQLLDYFNKNTSSCGQFTSEQLNRTIVPIEVPKSSHWARIAASLLLSFGLSSSANSQTRAHNQHTVQNKKPVIKKTPKVSKYKLKEALVRGERIYAKPVIDPENAGGRSVVTGGEVVRMSWLDSQCHKNSTAPTETPVPNPPATDRSWLRNLFK